MTKIEKYDALKEKGVELKHINNHSSDEIDALYTQYIETDASGNPLETPSDGETPDTPASGNPLKNPLPKARVLEFETSGWCEELKMSYRKGVYHPKSEKEYKALKKYAIQEK